ncbi:MAG: IS110 family transposase [Candidatus Latescibacterota bacterium]
MQVVYPSCAGLDVHKKKVVACRMQGEGAEGPRREVKTFSTMTGELLALADWLQEWGCTHVAMESTGDYWKPIFNVLEGSVEVLLVNAQHVKRVPGRKTDVRDAEWLADLLQHGLLKASFIPPAPQRDLRDLTRYRTTLVQERTRVVNRIQKLLEGANIKLSSVASDTLGVSGRAMLEALVEGQTDATALAQLAKGRLRNKREALEHALTGFFRPHHRFLLSRLLTHLDFLHEQLETLSDAIATHIDGMSAPREEASQDPGGAPGDASSGATDPPAAAPGLPLSPLQLLELWDTIPGVDQRVGQVMLAELGPDMSRFPEAMNAAAWAGVAPGNNESAGKHYSSRTTKGSPALRRVLIQAAWAAVRSRDTYLSALYHRLVPRRGKARAIVAVAHSILIAAYYMASRGEAYRDLGSTHFDERRKEAVAMRLSRRLERLGFTVTLLPQAVAA